MSIKRISRRRVAAPVMEYVDLEPLAAGALDNRTGGDVETKSNALEQGKIGSETQSRVDIRVQTKGGTWLVNDGTGNIPSRTGTNIETRSAADVEGRYSTTEPSSDGTAEGRNSPTKSRWSV